MPEMRRCWEVPAAGHRTGLSRRWEGRGKGSWRGDSGELYGDAAVMTPPDIGGLRISLQDEVTGRPNIPGLFWQHRDVGTCEDRPAPLPCVPYPSDFTTGVAGKKQ
jgi:hypothetical protein